MSPVTFLWVQFVVLHQPPDGLADLAGADEPRALEFPLRVLVPWAPAEIRVYEFLAAVGPAAVADVEIDDAVRRVEFAVRQ